MENRFLQNKIILSYCQNYYNIINERFNSMDLISDKLIQIYQSYIFKIDPRNKIEVKRVKDLNKAVTKYFEDREFKNIISNYLISLKVPKGTKDVMLFIVDNILNRYENYLQGYTRNIYIPRWI